ncbi:helix-turn-helix domain-containing protein [Arthrobacter sp. OAP107]|uniref:helix-turn-helix domain-containing protein n=1 Tax=Arthrobacter sp. OAP107 TaxID=3156445 RepID=UPI003392A511
MLPFGGTKKYAPISHERPTVISARFLSGFERITNADLLQARRSIRAIAKALGRSPWTIGREIRGTLMSPLATTVRERLSNAEHRRSRSGTVPARGP